MKEKNLVVISCLFLIAASFVAAYFSFYKSDFTFYESRLEFNESNVSEVLLYSPNNNYHTLFRSFLDESYISPGFGGNSISVLKVSCNGGYPYFFSSNYEFYSFDSGSAVLGNAWEYTQGNEYGCGFGDYYGFLKGEKYAIGADYYLNAENIFQVDGKNYIKFVAYSPKKHPTLSIGENLFILGDVVYKDKYYPRDSVIIYIPFNENISNKNIVSLKNFEYDNSFIDYWINLILGFLPAIILFSVWYFFGKEKFDIEVPSSLSSNPSKRKAWEVAVYFQPPFNTRGKNFISSILLELSNRKIIDIKVEKKFLGNDCFIKILNKKAKLDSTEKEFLEIISYALTLYTGKYSAEGYVNLAKIPVSKRQDLSSKFVTLGRSVEKQSKHFFESKGQGLFFLFNIVLAFILFYIADGYTFFLPILSLIIGFIFIYNSSLFVRFNNNYYKEYLEWQAFKKYLNAAPSLKLHGHKGVIVWGEYLTYAAALGVSARVIRELKNEGLISQEQYSAYTNVGYFASSAISSSSTGSPHGGAGGGGVGGGAGGGR